MASSHNFEALKLASFQKTIAVDYTRIPYMYILVLLMCNRHEKPGVGP